ncbi:hypothetical protein ACFXON_23855, partial [Bacillus subtilis]
MWQLLADRVNDGQAVMIEPAKNEQGWTVRTAGRDNNGRYFQHGARGVTVQCVATALMRGRIEVNENVAPRQKTSRSTSVGPAPAGMVPQCAAGE